MLRWLCRHALVEQLLGRPYQRARMQGGELVVENGVLGPRDILITAPYNIQVNRLQRRLSSVQAWAQVIRSLRISLSVCGIARQLDQKPISQAEK